MASRPSTNEELREAWNDVHVFQSKVIPSRGTYDPGPQARERWQARYRENLSFTDREIDRLLSALRKREDWDQTVVAVAGDHGEEFFERGTWHHAWNQLHAEGIGVPLIIRAPGIESGRVSGSVSLMDLAPTFLDFAGIAPAPTMMGRSLRPAMQDKAVANQPVITEMMGHIGGAVYRLAIRDGDWKYIYDIENPQKSELYRVSDDPLELVDLRADFPEVFRRFEAMRLAHVTRGLTHLMSRESRGRGNAFLKHSPGHETDDEMLRDQLAALGYL
jgi:arylsulfatase A-like enzyme